MRSYVPLLSLQNQFLLWSAYVRPYLQYLAPAVSTQTLAVQDAFHRTWRVTLKRFLRLPDSFPAAVFEEMFQSSELLPLPA